MPSGVRHEVQLGLYFRDPLELDIECRPQKRHLQRLLVDTGIDLTKLPAEDVRFR